MTFKVDRHARSVRWFNKRAINRRVPVPKPGSEPPGYAAVCGQSVFEHSPCGLIGTDGAGRILCANAAFGHIVGCDPDALPGRVFVDLLTVGSRFEYEFGLAPLLHKDGLIQHAALELRGRGGVRIPVQVSVVERRDDGGKAHSLAIAVFSVPERSFAERGTVPSSAVQDAGEGAQGAAELREQLIAILGHELRNPLAAMSSGIGILKREQSSERAQRVIALMEASMVRASVLIENVLDFARGRLGGGIYVDRTAPTPLDLVIQQVISEARLIAPGQEIIAQVDLPEPLAVDPTRLAQVISNLLGNALMHGDNAHPVTLRAAVKDCVFELSVTNAGEPIPEPMLANLFRPFYRGQGRPKRQGLGLGLFIASEIAKAHGGELTVSSVPNETRFTFRMPVA